MRKIVAAFAVLFVFMGAAPEGKPRIGIEATSLDKETAKKLKCPVRVGAVVTDVDMGSPASAGGLAKGDVISKIDSHSIGDLDALTEWTGKAKIGKIYRFTVYRQGNKGWHKLSNIVVRAGSDRDEGGGGFFDLEPDRKPRPKILDDKNTYDVAGGKLRISIDSPVIYLPATGTMQLFSFLSHAYRGDDGKLQRDKEGFYSIGGKAEEISLTTDDPKLLEISHHDKLGTILVPKEAGTPNIIATLAGTACKLSVKIERISLSEGDESKAVVKAFGLPDQEEMHYTSWPKTETYDDIIYSPTAGQSIIAAKHWHYNKFPHLVISIVDSKVYRIGSYDRKSTNEFVDWLNGN